MNRPVAMRACMQLKLPIHKSSLARFRTSLEIINVQAIGAAALDELRAVPKSPQLACKLNASVKVVSIHGQHHL